MRSEIITAVISAAATLIAAYIGKADFSDHRDPLAQLQQLEQQQREIQSLEDQLSGITAKLNSISGTVSNPAVRQQITALSTAVFNGSKQLAAIRKDLGTNIQAQNKALKRGFPFGRQQIMAK